MSEDQSGQDAGQDQENPREIPSEWLRGSRRANRRPAVRMRAQGPAEAPQPEGAPPPRRKRAGLEAFSAFLTFRMAAAVLAMIGAVYANHAIRQAGPLIWPTRRW